jgi:nucleoside phosphorylase
MPGKILRAEAADIARILKTKEKLNQSMVLLLGSRIGSLFYNDDFYNMMKEFSTRNFDFISREEQFAECYKILQKGRFTESDIHKILTASLQDTAISEADICLAEIIEQGPFDIIVSTNIDNSLENILKEIGLREQHDFKVFIPKQATLQNIPLLNKQLSRQVIKVFGDLDSRTYIVTGRESYFGTAQDVKSLLENILARDVLAVGCDPVWDAEICKLVMAQKSPLWFVTEEVITAEHPFFFLTEHERQIRYITGKTGSSERFFKNLYFKLHGHMPNYHPKEVANEARLLPKSSHDGPIEPIEGWKNSSVVPLISEHDRKSVQPMVESILPIDALSPSQQLIGQTVVTGVMSNSETLSADILLITVTEIEATAVLDCFPDYIMCFTPKRVYYELGFIGGARVFMVQSEMGSDGFGGSRFTVEEGINVLSPSAVIMVGVAFGINMEKQQIGDILVSRQLVAYDLQRIGSDPDGKPIIVIRGDRVSAPIRLLDRFKAGRKTWQKPPDIHFGLILSGAKLIDNQDSRDQLRQREVEAIGGEMEGIGLYEAAYRYSVDWLLVKAICDWADGNKDNDKDSRQKEAARNAARFTIHVIQQGGFRNSRVSR